MNTVLVSSEVVPFAKTGGLADVAGALPRAIEQLGHHIVVVLPCYAQARAGRAVQPTEWRLEIPIGKKTVAGEVYRAKLPGSDVPVYLIEQPEYFDRPALYGEKGKDYLDNCERFVFFSRACLELARQLPFEVDCIHANDWQTGLVPVYLNEMYRSHASLRATGSLFTLHNMAFQGRFWHWDMLLTGLDWRLFNWRELEFFGNLNLLKAGIVFADAVNTVSKRYADEIQTTEFGAGLEGVLQARRSDLFGIMNGIDYSVWNPETDPHIAANYNEDTFVHGKPKCKESLQAEQRLPVRPDVPLFGMVTRLDDQKGLDLVAAMAEEFLNLDVQLVVLGTGQPKYHTLIEDLARRFVGKVGVNLRFDDALAHRIYAGCDAFLMPSRYEPCGLNQLISLKYATVPVVRATGGLADTIVDCTPESLTAGRATGFSFDDYGADALLSCVRRALNLWAQRDSWRRLQRNGMIQDWSWTRSAVEYVNLYERVRAKRAEPILAR
jgi:starch synthase